MQKARRHPEKSRLRPLVGARFQVLFHSPVRSSFHLSLTVLVHYRSLSSIQPYQMVLADSHRISPVPWYSGYCQVVILFRLQDYHLLWFSFPEIFCYKITVHVTVLQPRFCRNKTGLGFSPFARHYLGNHYYFLFLCLLRCFSSAGQLPLSTDFRPSTGKVSPFGNLRIEGYLHLPAAYRSLSRPSSPLRAKAFAVRPYLLS